MRSQLKGNDTESWSEVSQEAEQNSQAPVLDDVGLVKLHRTEETVPLLNVQKNVNLIPLPLVLDSVLIYNSEEISAIVIIYVNRCRKFWLHCLDHETKSNV